MFKSVLVANRGEIACRVFRTAQQMGVRTIAVYSEADADALHVRMADDAVLIGPAPARESYLDAAKVLAAAKQSGAEAIHPGYGFLSENADFAEAVAAAGLVWIGPPPAAIRAMGLKDAAKKLMIEAGVPVTPGYQGEDQSVQTLSAEAARIGYPVLIKAVAGGGGKGMKLVEAPEDFASGLASAQREGQSSFGDPRVLIESYITCPRHIEVQVFGDSHGTVVHLHERDCSLQRRHQKVIEEAPAPGMDQATRDAVTSAAVRAAQAVNYQGAGTIEFIADASDGLKADRIWFMEMNTRLQVEHPVTEAITGVDLVEWQFRVAAGEPIPLKQADIPINGWAMEARLYAEDPANGFLPSIGRLEHFRLPLSRGEREIAPESAAIGLARSGEGVRCHDGSHRNPSSDGAPPRHLLPMGEGIRIDTGVEQGGEVSQFYDPMIAKLIVHENTREAAAEALADACAQVEAWPVRTNAGFLVRCLEHPRFVEGDVDTGFIGAEEASLVPAQDSDLSVAAALGWRVEEFVGATYDNNIWGPSPDHLFGFRLNGEDQPARLKFRQDGALREAVVRIVERAGDWSFDFAVDGVPLDYSGLEAGESLPTTHGDELIRTFRNGDVSVFDFSPIGGTLTAGPASDGALRAPMPGKIVAIPARPGDTVAKGQPVVVLEAMKMEHALVAPFDGEIGEIGVSVGDQVAADAVLAKVEAAA